MHTNNTIYTNFLSALYIKDVDVKEITFEEIFNIIKRGDYRNVVKKIREKTDHEVVQTLKKYHLPAFFPTILINGEMKNRLNDESVASGIVQFDIDKKDNSDLDLLAVKKEVINLPETFYAFISPSNGLKIGVKTDFIKHNQESINELKYRYKQAYNITREWLIEKLPSFDITFDSKVGCLKAACYLSDDIDAYFNQTCMELKVDHLCKEEIKKYKPIITDQTHYRNFLTDSLNFTPEQITEMLTFISPNRGYDDRVPINLAVMSAFGYDAIEQLVYFWSKTEKDQLRKQIQRQFNDLHSGVLKVYNYAFLNAAVAGGYTNPFLSEKKTGALRTTLEASDLTDNSYKLTPLLSSDDAVVVLKNIIKAFFKDKQSRFINFSTGAGKTRTILKVLEGINPQTKILYLVKSHALAEEIIQSFNIIRAERIKAFSRPLDATKSRSRIAHLLGRGDFTKPNRLCENTQLLKSLAKNRGNLDKIIAEGSDLSTYKDGFHPFPAKFCGSDPNYKVNEISYMIDGVQHIFEEDVNIDEPDKSVHETCMYQAECRYTEQFNNFLANIRVMTHDELFNAPSKFFSGTNANRQPRANIFKNPTSGWLPDYIVVDEDIFKVEEYILDAENERFPVIADIITAVQSGVELKEAIMDNRVTIFLQASKNKRHHPHFTTTANYLKKVNKPIKKGLKFSELFENLCNYAMHEEEFCLKGMRLGERPVYENKKMVRMIPALIQSTVKSNAHRYRNTPTIFLDATANRTVVEQLLPNVKFYAVNVESKEDIRLIQLQNYTFTQTQLIELKTKELEALLESPSEVAPKKKRKGEKFLDDILYGLKKLADSYTSVGKSVGIISYKSIPEITEGTGFDTFPEFLADKMEISLYGHFGNLRGSNAFDSVDCLIILGRYFSDNGSFNNYHWAIFNKPACNDREYKDSPVRMKNGSIKLLNSQVSTNDESRAIVEHCSLSETKQAIGRGRMIHGHPKDIYYLSNEYIGSDIETSDFIKYDDLFLRMISAECLDQLNDIGYLLNKPKAIMDALGIAKSFYNTNKDQIYDELKFAGYIWSEVSFVKSDSKPATYQYFIKDESALLDYLKPHPKHPVTIVPIK